MARIAMATLAGREPDSRGSLAKLLGLNWMLIFLVCVLAGIGFVALYSAASGSFDPWAKRQMVRFGVGMAGAVAVAAIDIRRWLSWSWWLYGGCLALLIAVEIAGTTGMGATRWLDLGVARIQPSEFAKIALVMALAGYYHRLDRSQAGQLRHLLLPALMILAPAVLILRQPDLGTALMVMAVGGTVVFLAGLPVWLMLAGGGLAAVSAPLAWHLLLHDYQKQRVLTFLDPQRDPLGAGYHVVQSKIALGSGGAEGKGFLMGTQSHLNFLPEKQTDFIFTLFAEEWGFQGALVLLALYALVILYGIMIGLRARSQFARLLTLGLTTNLFFYVLIDIGMGMGLLPVVGMPLPLISYGGTVMLSVLLGIGLMQSAWIHRDVAIPRRFRG